MYFLHATYAHQSRDVAGVDAAAGQNLDAPFRLSHEALDAVRAVRGRARASRRQHAIDAEPDQGLERSAELEAGVEGAMKRERQRPSRFDQSERAALGDAPAVGELAGDDAQRARVLDAAQLLERRLVL